MSEHLPDCDVRLYGNDTYPIPCTCAEERLLAAEARIAELEAALSEITKIGPCGVPTYPAVYGRIQEIARAALSKAGSK